MALPFLTALIRQWPTFGLWSLMKWMIYIKANAISFTFKSCDVSPFTGHQSCLKDNARDMHVVSIVSNCIVFDFHVKQNSSSSRKCFCQIALSFGLLWFDKSQISPIYIAMTSQWAGWRLKSPASRLFTQPFIRAQIKENIKARVTGLCVGNSPGTGESSAQMASNAETASIWWRHHDLWVTSLTPGLSCPRASEATLKGMDI